MFTYKNLLNLNNEYLIEDNLVREVSIKGFNYFI